MGIKHIFVFTSVGHWREDTAFEAKREEGTRWLVVHGMPRGAYCLATSRENMNGTCECHPNTNPAEIRIRFFAGNKDEEIRPETFKGRKKSWN